MSEEKWRVIGATATAMTVGVVIMMQHDDTWRWVIEQEFTRGKALERSEDRK